jgi:putative spermidine/putrescine transport system ATP-binding protein/spermidine/putrescine transport system ATP-binding protein
MPALAVELNGVAKRFGDFTAVHRLSMSIGEGEFVTLLGPSGCGKTTTLRMIAGLLDPSEGDIIIRGRRMNDVPIHRRNLGLVFQNYALFPHRSVFDNVAFGLKYRGVKRQDIQRRVSEALELVQLPHLADRFPKALSGGQQQRIALARAIVIEPDVLLLDEPLSALDANLRDDMRVELKRIQHRIGVSTVFVTHDQSEALAMSDQIIVMSAGRVEQAGTPEDVYDTPNSEFVARFLGGANILDVDCTALDAEQVTLRHQDLGQLQLRRERAPTLQSTGRARLVIRGEKIKLRSAAPGMSASGLTTSGTAVSDNTSSGTALPGEHWYRASVDSVDYQGQAARYFLTLGSTPLQATNMLDERLFRAAEIVSICLKASDCTALPA